MAEKYINPFTDFGFKKLFGNEFNKDLLIDFLNEVLGGREQIKQLTYLNGENQGRTETDRRAVFDLYCENEKGERFIIEVQNARQEFFKDRSIFYATFPIQEQAAKGNEWNYELKAVYAIAILNFGFPDQPGLDRCMREVKLLDTQTNEPFYEKLSFIYLEMPRFKKREDELVTHFDKWLYVLKNLSNLQARPQALQNRIFEKLFNEAEIAKLNPTDMNAYEQSLKVLRDNYSAMESLKKESRMEGRMESLIEMARIMKADGEPVEKISRYTGLTAEEIEKL
jgi:predicted transposase/invertase (TIGR01784 family)